MANKRKVVSCTEIKVEIVEDVKFQLEDMHHEIDIKEEIDTAEYVTEGNDSYVCEICSRKCGNKIKLDRHLEYHFDADDKPFTCEICQYKFAYEVNLKSHSESHVDEKPFRAEYAKSHRSRCHCCKLPIKQGNLRIAVMERSQMFDGRMTRWHHPDCFFDGECPRTEAANFLNPWVSYDGLVEHFELLSQEDQEWIRNKFEFKASAAGSQEKVDERDTNKEEVSRNFLVEYAKSKYDACKACEKKIKKDEIRILIKVYPTKMINKAKKRKNKQQEASNDLGQAKWHHLTCFAKLRSDLEYFESGENLYGFKTLRREDQEQVKKQLPAIQRGNPAKKRKL